MEALVDLFEDDAVFLAQPGEQPVRGTAAIREASRAFLGMNGTCDMERTELIAREDVAVVFATWTLKGASDPEGNPIDLADQTTDVGRRQPDGSWRFATG